MANFFSNIKMRVFWVLFGVLIVVTMLTAQAPKTPQSGQAASEIGRYVFWSVPLKDGSYKYGFLDTKRGRVWSHPHRSIYGKETDFEYGYIDLNEYAADVYWYGLSEVVGKDTTEKTYRRIDSLVAEFKREVKEKEK